MQTQDVLDILSQPLTLFFDTSERLALPYLFAALVIAICIYWRSNFTKSKNRLSDLRSWLLPMDIITHPSARADYWMFVINKSLIVAIYASIPGQALFWVWAVDLLFGQPPAPVGSPSIWIALFYTCVIAVVLDGTLWFAHLLFHKIPILWEFHKVHHSAEVMTPITATRMHPVEELFSATLSGVTMGITYQILNHIFGAGHGMILLFQTNLILGVFFLAAFNLRHSHVWFQYPFWLQHIFISPAQHQIHHSKAKHHWDKNMGFIFAIWDWAAGTLYAPKGKENISYGLGTHEDGHWNSARSLYFRPFKNALALLRKDRRNRKPVNWDRSGHASDASDTSSHLKSNSPDKPR
ncbi:MAG: sterol desaturase family protein [Paracoccaceae bacterium]